MRNNSWYEGEHAVGIPTGTSRSSHHYREINIFGYIVQAFTCKTKGKRNKAWTYARSRRSPFQHANA